MHAFFKYVVATVVLICVFFAGALTGSLRHWFQPLVQVTIRNDSGQDITEIILTHQSSGIKSTMVVGSIPKGEKKRVTFYVRGEGGYGIEAILEDGRKIAGGSGYVESGYSVTEVVDRSSIKPVDFRYGE